VASLNVGNVMRLIREQSPTLREMLDRGEIGIAGGMYDVHSGRVTFLQGAAAAVPAATG
jgi:carbonic anhydrase